MGSKLMSYRNYNQLILDMSDVPMIGSSTAMVIEELLIQSRAAGCSVAIVGLQNPVAHTLEKLQVLNQIPENARFEHRIQALQSTMPHVSLNKTSEMI